MTTLLDTRLGDEAFLKTLLGDLDAINAEAGDGSEVNAALAAGGVGLAGSLAALYGLGTVGLSAIGITTGLAAAGALLGGGPIAGIVVLMLPVLVLALAGHFWGTTLKRERVLRLQSQVLAKALLKQQELRFRMQERADLSEGAIAAIDARDQLLQQMIEALTIKMG